MKAHAYTAAAAFRLASYLTEQERYAEAGELYARWVPRLKQIPDQEPMDSSWMMSDYRTYLELTGQEEKAKQVEGSSLAPESSEADTRKEWAKRQRTLGPEHPDTLESLYHLANVCTHRGDLSEAERMHREVVEARERTLGPDHPEVADSLYQLAKLLQLTDRTGEAESAILRAMDIQERRAGKESSNMPPALRDSSSSARRRAI